MLMNIRTSEPDFKVLQSAICQRLSTVTAFAYPLLECREKSVGDVHRLIIFCGGCRRVVEQCPQCCGRWGGLEDRFVTLCHGNQAGQKAVRRTVEHCARLGVETLTVFAFSSENWSRPQQEVSRLMELFIRALDREAVRLHENNIRISFIGDRSAFEPAVMRNAWTRPSLIPLSLRMSHSAPGPR